MILDTLELYELAKPVYDSTGCLQSVTFEDKNIKTKLYITRNLSVERKKDVQNLKLPSLIWKYFHTAYAGESFSRMYKGVMDLIRFGPGRSTSMRDSLSLLTQNVRATEEAAASKTISIEHLGLIIFQSWLPSIIMALFFSAIMFVLLLLVLFLNMKSNYSELTDKMTDFDEYYERIKEPNFNNFNDEEALKFSVEHELKLRLSIEKPKKQTFHISHLFG